MSVPIVIPPTSPYLSAPDAVILDASWLYNPPPDRDALREFTKGPRYPRARWWDLEAISEPHPEGYPLMLPSPERFASFAGKHGITKDSHVIVYDGEGIFAAPRTAFTFKVYGHDKVSVIDGGLPKGKQEGVKLEEGPAQTFEETTYPVPTAKPRAIIEFDEIVKLAGRGASTEGATVLLDARPTESYEEGHIPSSLSLGFPDSLLTAPEGYTHLRQSKDLKDHLISRLGEKNVDEILKGDIAVANTCGGGLSAAINWLQLQTLGVNSRLYDESWSGYSAREGTARVTGSKVF